jgi:hypothetical protein
VTNGEFGDAWPLTVSKGILRCEWNGEITFQDDGTTYSLTWKNNHGSYDKIAPIWADAAGGAGKMDLAPLIERGRELCK